MKTARGKAFTLIELMVVVAIIAVLIMFMTPAIVRATDMARQASCESQLHQLTLAWISYSGANRGGLVGANCGQVPHDWTGWDQIDIGIDVKAAVKASPFYEYNNTLSVYKCANDPRTEYVRSYSISNFTGGQGGWYITPALRFTQIPNAANTMVFLEENDPRGLNYNSWVVYPTGHPSSQSWIDWTANFHNNGFNHSFADGHVLYYGFKDPRTVAINDFYWMESNSPDLQYVQSIYNTNKLWNP